MCVNMDGYFSFMLTDFGLAHPSIKPTRHKETKSVPNDNTGTSSSKQRSSSCDLDVRQYSYYFCKLIFFCY